MFLRGGRPTFGPKAAELSGIMYRNLYDHNYFAARPLDSPLRNVSQPTVGAPQ